MTTQEIVSKLWSLCDVLRDDGITYHQYVTELTYLLFLKMAKETGTEEKIPPECRWDALAARSGTELKSTYEDLLERLGSQGKGHLQAIYGGAVSHIEEPANLEKIISTIDALDWFSAREEGLGNLYEGLLEKNANEKKSGAGQYFTPRPLINVVTRLIKPQPGERCNDPACGTFGFMIAAAQFVKDQTDNFFTLSTEEADFEIQEAFTGCELVKDTHRLAMMNAMLHGLNGDILNADTLSNDGKVLRNYDVVLTNPPFGTKKGGERATRDDLTYPTSNKQLNFLQHIYRSLRTTGQARAAVVVPDNVLFVGGDGERIRRDLMEKCSLHTILRLPSGIFYAQGVKTNVLFFHRGATDTGNTKEIWVYDLRSNMPSFGKTNPMTEDHYSGFVKAYEAQDRRAVDDERWRCFSYEEVLKRDKTSLDLKWIKDEDECIEGSIEDLMQMLRDTLKEEQEAFAELEKLINWSNSPES